MFREVFLNNMVVIKGVAVRVEYVSKYFFDLFAFITLRVIFREDRHHVQFHFLKVVTISYSVYLSDDICSLGMPCTFTKLNQNHDML